MFTSHSRVLSVAVGVIIGFVLALATPQSTLAQQPTKKVPELVTNWLAGSDAAKESLDRIDPTGELVTAELVARLGAPASPRLRKQVYVQSFKGKNIEIVADDRPREKLVTRLRSMGKAARPAIPTLVTLLLGEGSAPLEKKIEPPVEQESPAKARERSGGGSTAGYAV